MRLAVAGLVLATGIAASATTAGAAPDRIAESSHKPCQRLKGEDLAPHRRVKLVERPVRGRGHELVGCVLPGGKIRRVAEGGFSGVSRSYRIRQVARTIVLLDTSMSHPYVTETSVDVYDIRTGRRYTIASGRDSVGDSGGSPPDTSAPGAVVNKAGQALAAISQEGSSRLTISGFSPTGSRVDLDSGTAEEVPPGSLSVDHSTGYWTHSGQARSAPLPD